MSTIERACRWTIAQAYLDWTLARHATFAWRRYCAALDLDAGWTDPPRGDALMPEHCIHCEEPLLVGERVFRYANGPVAHHACFLRQVLGAVAHQQHRCACFVAGSPCGDDPALTPRQAAEAAAAYWDIQCQQP